MDTALTIKDAGMILIGAGIIILIAYTIAFMKNLVVTIKHTNKILEDAQVVTKITAERSKEVDKMIDGAVSSVSVITESFKGNQSKLTALATLINTIAAAKKVVKSK